MNYSLPVKKKTKKSRKIFIGFAIFLIALFTFFPQAFGALGRPLFVVAMPFWNAGTFVRDAWKESSSVYLSKKTLVRENNDLHLEIAKLKREIRGYDVLIQQNIELKKELFGKTLAGKIGTVVARPVVSEYDTLLVDIGTVAGVEKGDVVLADSNIVLGTVEEVYPYSSKVRMYSSPGRKSDVLIGPSNISVQIEGNGGGSFSAQVPHGLNIIKGDAAILPGGDGFILGYVVSLEENTSTSFDTVRLSGTVNIFELKYIEAIRPNE